MTGHDLEPPAHLQRTALAWARYKQLMKWMTLVAVAAALLALLYLGQGEGPMPVHMVIATLAGVGLTVLLGTALMGLVFLSNASGHDDAATRKGERRDD